MEILGVGPSELALIVIVALILLGPTEMKKTGRMIGKWLYDFVRSDEWKTIKNVSDEITHLPNRLMRDAALDELNLDTSLSTSKPIPTPGPAAAEGASIAPPTLTVPSASPNPQETSESVGEKESPDA